MSSQYGHLFNSLSGRELRRAIIREVEDLLENDERFNSNIAYPKVSFRFSIELKVYPREPESFALSTEKVYGESTGEPVEVSLSREHEHQHPDKVRQFTGDPIPQPRKVQHVGTVDLTAEQVQASHDPRYFDRNGKEEFLSEAEPLIIPATEMPSEEEIKRPKEMVPVGGVNGAKGQRAIEIEGHVANPHEIDLETESREPAVRVSIANDAAMRGDWAKRQGLGRPVHVDDKVPSQ